MSEYIINSEDYVLGMATIPYLREKIVRCRDCKWCMAYASATYCIRMSTHTVEPDGFCAWGERRES